MSLIEANIIYLFYMIIITQVVSTDIRYYHIYRKLSNNHPGHICKNEILGGAYSRATLIQGRTYSIGWHFSKFDIKKDIIFLIN